LYYNKLVTITNIKIALLRPPVMQKEEN
jgi:hypothetical protein